MADSPSSPVAVCFRCRGPIAAAEYRFAERTLEEMAAVVGVPKSEQPDWVAIQSPVCPACLESQRVWRLRATIEVAPAERTGPLPAESVPAPRPRRPWWKRKRAWAAVALSLLVAYPASLGPLTYAYVRGWVSGDVIMGARQPVKSVLLSLPTGRIRETAIACNFAYSGWWADLARRHAPD